MIEPSNAIHIFLLGASFMFCLIVAHLFRRRGGDTLSRLVIVLMIVMAAGFAKDMFVNAASSTMIIELSTISDLVVLPLYVAIIYELCRPGRQAIWHLLVAEVPFVALPVLFAIFRNPIFYYIDMTLALVFGVGMGIWSCFAIPRYHRHLKATFSYVDSINLGWLQCILWTFLAILIIWVVSCVTYSAWIEVAYTVITLQMWIFVCYFLYKHKSVVDELRPVAPEPSGAAKVVDDVKQVVFTRIRHLIEEERIYLNPTLKLSDIARMAHTNRTYASAYFSSEVGETFYDHINRLRVDHAIVLLADGAKRLEEIALASGFNSRQSFHRVFSKIKGLSPLEYRTSAKLLDIQT